MGYYAVWPYFAGLTLICWLVSTAPFRALDAPPHHAGARVTSLDGLRGFLALSVVFSHVAVFHNLLVGARWDLSPSRFYTMVGQVAVVLFFMVTSYLFWGRLVRGGFRLDWRAFFIGRVFRIGPVYLLAVLIMLLGLFVLTGFVLRVRPWVLAGQLALWLPLGLTKSRRVNGSTLTTQLLAGVTWTLSYEWFFYLALPLLAWAGRRTGRHMLWFVLLGTGVALLVAPVLAARPAYLILAFCLGGLCASWEVARPGAAGPDWLCSGIVVAALTLAIVGFATAYTVGAILLLAVVFRCVSAGCSVFGLLTSRGAKRLGNISYAVYLLQGLVLNAVFLPARALAVTSPAAHWALAGGVVLGLAGFAGVVHVVIERPAIALGQRLVRGGGTRARVGRSVVMEAEGS
jgi:peptidoglycan/LPS O-acetylase OafA/YrhL